MWGTWRWAGQVHGTLFQGTTLHGTGLCTAYRPSCTPERDLLAGSMGRQGQGLPTGLLHAGAGGPAGLQVQQTLPGSRDEPLPAPSSFLPGSIVLAATYSSASHSLQLWKQSWHGEAQEPLCRLCLQPFAALVMSPVGNTVCLQHTSSQCSAAGVACISTSPATRCMQQGTAWHFSWHVQSQRAQQAARAVS